MERATYWQSPVLDGLELLKARYLTHCFAPHTHEGYVIGVVEGGVETFRYRGERHVAAKDHLIFINPDEMHTGSAGAEEGWSYRTLYPTVAQLQTAAQQVFEGKGVAYFKQAVVYDPSLARLIRDFHQLAESKALKLEQENAFLAMLVALLTRYADAKPRRLHKDHHRGVERARAYLSAYPEKDISLSKLSEVTGLSPYHLTRTFKRKVGLSPHAYQISERVKCAKLYLTEGKPLSQVALETGFSDQSHFGRHFKRLVGVTPGQFVKGAIFS